MRNQRVANAVNAAMAIAAILKLTPSNSLPPSENCRESTNAWVASNQGMMVRITNAGNAQSVREKLLALANRLDAMNLMACAHDT